MSKKLYITKEQLCEVLGADADYLNNTIDPHFKENGSIEVFTGDKFDNEDSEPQTTDKVGKMQTRNDGMWGIGRGYGRDTMFLRCSKEDWLNRRVLNEINQDIDGKMLYASANAENNMMNAGLAKDSVGSNMLQNGIKGQNLPEYVHRFKEAEKEARNGNPTKLNNMGGEETKREVERMYNQQKKLSKINRDSRQNGSKIKSAPKTTGNGEAHTSKTDNGIITYEN